MTRRIFPYIRFLALSAAAVLALSACAPFGNDDRLTEVLGPRTLVVITTDGGKELISMKDLPLKPGMTVLDALDQVAEVKLAADNSVVRINGLGGGRIRALGPEPSRWFYRVNGIESNIPAEKYRLVPGSTVWWDLREFDSYPVIPVSIGNFPNPVISGYRDVIRPVRIVYGSKMDDVAQDYARLLEKVDPEIEPLRDTGFGTSDGEPDSRTPPIAVKPRYTNIVFARWEDARLDPYVADMAVSPQTYGITTWIEGSEVRRQNVDDLFSRKLDGVEGIVWATTIDSNPDSAIIILVTGVTDDGVRRAAAALRGGAFAFQLSGAVDRSGQVVP